ncbi:hypothetical protein E3A20_02520 [Planctomyces bekefii]|uniref:Rrf2 family transcriptional regulator n=1 Tax=Planctomyces bekefii TaxID=1653850 RepID=A0A5C6MDV6_9PLAN|nr:hypothetical protein E3A20_02520 [Planctomyces bekefii]
MGQLGFLINSRGRGGGVALARPSSEISVGDVIRQMESNFDFVECFSESTNTCPITKVCGLKSALLQARGAFLAALDSVTLADVTVNRRALAQLLSN